MLQFLIHGSQIVISAYSLLNSGISIPNLLQWEDSAKKASKVSGAAETELWTVRKTQAAGAIAGVVSLLAASGLGFHFITANTIKAILINVLVALLTAGSSLYIGNNWNRNAKIPGVSTYNAAVEHTKQVRSQLALLSFVWGASAFFEVWGAFAARKAAAN